MSQSEAGEPLQHILVVDDQVANLASLEEILSRRYRVSLSENGQVCLDLAEKISPDLILLDVDMPMMDGFTVCRKLKADLRTSSIPVIFLSALSRLEERLAGYYAGADDYASKPYRVDELQAKIRIALNNRYDLESARERSSRMLGYVKDTLSTYNELQDMRCFIGDTLDCADLRALGDHLLKTFDHFGLRVIVRMLGNGHYFSHAGEVGALDREMMEVMYGKGRLIDFGHRTLINADKISVLVRNMPVHDVSRYRRWKESLSLLVGIVSSRMTALESANFQHHHIGLNSLMRGLNQLINHLQDPSVMMDQEYATSHLSRLIDNWESHTQQS